MSRIRTVFLGTPEIGARCLTSMLKDEHFEIVGVVSQPDRPAGRKMRLQPSPVKQLALDHNLPVLSPEKVSVDDVLAQIAGWRAEAAVVVAFGQILSQKFLDLFPKRVVNVHTSLLPRWRGAAPVQRALINGDKETGVSLQIVVKKMDAGDLLGLRRIPLPPEVNAVDVFERTAVLGAELLAIELMDYLRGHLTPHPQDETLVTMAPKIDKQEALVDWTWPAERIHNLVRGLAAGPVALTTRDGKILKIHQTRVLDVGASGAPGRLREASGLHVECGQGILEILKLQPESRSMMTATEYLRGHPVRPGDQFVSRKP